MIYDLPPHSSFSQVGTYTRCGEQFRLERLARAPQEPAWALLGGSAVHTASEAWDNAYLQGEVFHDKDIIPLWAEHFAAQIAEAEAKTEAPRSEWRASGRRSKAWPDKETEAFWNENGPVFLANWASWRLNSPWEIWTTNEGQPAIEIGFTVDIGGVLVKGAIDRIMVDRDGNVFPVDLKSGGEPDDTLQLGTYAKAMRDLMGVTPKWGTYWMARAGMTTALHPMDRFSDEHLAYIYGNARKGMEAGIFLPKVSRMCSGCSVRAFCFAVGGESAAEYTPLS